MLNRVEKEPELNLDRMVRLRNRWVGRGALLRDDSGQPMADPGLAELVCAEH